MIAKGGWHQNNMYDLKGKVVKAEFLTKRIKFVRVELLGDFSFSSGQFVNVEVAQNFYRSYSICSPAANLKSLEFVVDITPGGKGSQYFEKLNINEGVHIKGPFGRLILPESVDSDLCFGATGTGIAPFRSMTLELLNKGFKKQILLYWGLRYKEDIFFKEEFEELSKKFPNFSFLITLSRPEGWSGKSGHVTNYVGENVGAGMLFYLCGNQQMIDDVKGVLLGKGVLEEKIRFEKFF